MIILKKHIMALMLATSLVLTACGGTESKPKVEVDPNLGAGMTDAQKEKNDRDILDKVMKATQSAVKESGFNKTFEIKIIDGETKVVCQGSSDSENEALVSALAKNLGISESDIYNETAGKLCMDSTKGKGITASSMFSDTGTPTVLVFAAGNKKISSTTMATAVNNY